MSHIPRSLCFRVTRACNARCGFCLAPWNGAHPEGETLLRRLDWLLTRGVQIVHFCGGEPTIHPALPELLRRVHQGGGVSRLTTNGILFPEALLQAVRDCGTQVKVSLHGSAAQHDRLVGRVAHEKAVGNLRRLLAAGVRATVQTTLVAGSALEPEPQPPAEEPPEIPPGPSGVIDEMVSLCRSMGVRRLSLLPFIPRGDGALHEARYALTTRERRALRGRVARLRQIHIGKLELRWLDFATQPVAVVEADGRLLLDGPNEGRDVLIANLEVGTPPVAPLQSLG